MPHSRPVLMVSLPPTIYCSGSYVEGEVLLDFRRLQTDSMDEVHVKLRGSSHACIQGDEITDRETRPLVSTNIRLWTRGTAYPPPGNDILHLFFSFLLPPDLPSSFQFRAGYQKSASVLYAITVVGHRPGRFHINERIRLPIAVVPKDEIGPQLKNVITNSTFTWRKIQKEEKVRKGLWGGHGTVRIELSLPEVPVLPLFTDIPFVLDIVTTSALLSRAKAEAQSSNKVIFPAPPVAHSQITFRMHRNVTILAKGSEATADMDVAWFFGDHTSTRFVNAEIDLPDKEWVVLQRCCSEKGKRVERGTWRQRATFRSQLNLNATPTFTVNTIQCDYYMFLKVPFEGMGNDVVLSFPIVIASGIDAAIPRGKQRPTPHDRVPISAQPQLLDLPSAYWNVKDHIWGSFNEKD